MSLTQVRRVWRSPQCRVQNEAFVTLAQQGGVML